MRLSVSRGPILPSSPNGKTFSYTPVVKNAPISPQEALDNYSSLLMPYELTEIQGFTNIYFLGYPNAKNKIINESTYLYKINPKDHIAYRYEIVKILGSGSYGKVFQVIDHKIKKQIAIKIFIDQEKIKKQIDNEATILSLLNKHKCSNTVKGLDYFFFRSHACITFELLGENLYVQQIKNENRPLRQSIVRDYAIQIFSGLLDIHKLGIVHCDMKPENICSSLDDLRRLKLVDFGSAVIEGGPCRSYVQSRFYRAPEVILRLKYGPKIDVWGAAIVVMELLTGAHVFPGRSELEMLNMMERLIGPVPRAIVRACRRRKSPYFDAGGKLKPFSVLAPKKSATIEDILGANGSPQLVDFLERCLRWMPSARMSAVQALEHPWLRPRGKHGRGEGENLPTLIKCM